MIPFNKPFLIGDELKYIKESVDSGKISGNGIFTQRCHQFFKNKYGFKKVLLTTSCTDALEMAAILCDIQPGDEVVIPSYTFVSTANAFALRGARLVFADSELNNPNIDLIEAEKLITPRTKVLCVVHYAGVACDMEKAKALAKKYNLKLVEDAAQAIDSFHNGVPLGSIGDFAAFSFHETKNVISGEGGMLAVNNAQFERRAEIIWEKGTNRAEFFRGEVDKYGWVDIGSSFLPSELIAAFLLAQLESLDQIQAKRKTLWNAYQSNLEPLAKAGKVGLPNIPPYASVNAHMYYLVCKSLDERTQLIAHLKKNGINAVFHYLSLHASPYFHKNHDGRKLPNSDRFTDCLVRLPLYYELSTGEVSFICDTIRKFYGSM